MHFYNFLGAVSSRAFHISHRFFRMDCNISFSPKRSVNKDRTSVDEIRLSKWQINKAVQNKICTEQRKAKLQNAIGRLRELKYAENENLKRIQSTLQIHEQKLLNLVSTCLFLVFIYELYGKLSKLL